MAGPEHVRRHNTCRAAWARRSCCAAACAWPGTRHVPARYRRSRGRGGSGWSGASSTVRSCLWANVSRSTTDTVSTASARSGSTRARGEASPRCRRRYRHVSDLTVGRVPAPHPPPARQGSRPAPSSTPLPDRQRVIEPGWSRGRGRDVASAVMTRW